MLIDDTGLLEKEVDAHIKYPCWKSFDEIIDVEQLKSLNDYIIERIERHIQAQKDSFFWNEYRLDGEAPDVPGVREIWLTETRPGVPYNYQDLNKPDLWQPTEAADEFSEVMSFISELPFKATGRILIIYDNTGAMVPAHRDHLETDICHEFLGFGRIKTNRFICSITKRAKNFTLIRIRRGSIRSTSFTAATPEAACRSAFELTAFFPAN